MRSHLTPAEHLEQSRISALARHREKYNKPTAITPKLEDETEDEYIERVTRSYAGSAYDTTPPALLDRARSFVRAMASLAFQQPASDEMQRARIDVCLACDHFDFSFSTPPEQVGHCSACGCGKNKFSSIGEKAKILASSCPKKYWDIAPPPPPLPPVQPPQ